MLRRVLVVIPVLSALAVLVGTVLVYYFVVYLDDSATVPMFAAAAVVSATATYLTTDRDRVRLALAAGIASPAWFALSLLLLWVAAIWTFDPD